LLVGIGFARLGFLATRAAGGADHPGVITVLFAALAVGWVLLPILLFGVDELLDPSRLALFPLTGRQLTVGLLASSAVGIPPVATFVALLGTFPGFVHGASAVPFVAAAVVLQLVTCLVLSRAVTTALSGLLRSRRGRDATSVILALTAASIGLVGPPIALAVTRLDSSAGRALQTVSRYSPLGAAGGAVAAAGTGDLAAAAGQLALCCCYVAAAAVWWQRSLRAAITSVEAHGSRRRTGAAADLRPRWTRPILPRSAIGAVAAKDLHYLWRDPMRRTALLSTLGPAAIGLFSGVSSGGGDPRSVLFAMVTATMLSLISLNQFGLDGAAYWMNIVAGPDPRRDLVGKNLAVALVALPATAVVASILAAFTGGWVYVPLAVAGGCAGCGATLGVGNVVSVRSPAPQPENPMNAWGTGGAGQSMAAGFTQLGAMLLVAVVLAPLGIFIAYSAVNWTPGLFVAAPLSVAYGLVLWRAGLRYTARLLFWRQAELLNAIRISKAA
jgi:ABC-2 type transport system permease protein